MSEFGGTNFEHGFVYMYVCICVCMLIGEWLCGLWLCSSSTEKSSTPIFTLSIDRRRP